MKKNQMGGACSMYGAEEMCMRDFGWKPEEKRSLGRPRRRWEGDIIGVVK
jgi:hypothetical protein